MNNKTILDYIGNTPMIKLRDLSEQLNTNIYAKLEGMNPGLSIKDRTVLFMIEQAEINGEIFPGKSTIIEATSGNTGYSLAMICAVKGYKCVIAVKDNSSVDKIEMIKVLGAEVILCPSNVEPEHEKSYYKQAERLSKLIPNSYYLNQNSNINNYLAHYHNTAEEIWKETDGKITHLISPASTVGTVSGVAKFLKEKNHEIKVIATDSEGSVLKKFHETKIYDKELKRKTIIEGVGKDIIPENALMEYIDTFIKIDDIKSVSHILNLAKTEGILVGGSSGATISCLMEIQDELTPDSTVVLIFSDHGVKYLSSFYNFDWQKKNNLDSNNNEEVLKIINDYYLKK